MSQSFGSWPGGDLDRARAELRLHGVVRHHRDLAPDEGQKQVAPDALLVALVIGVHGDAGVADHRFRTGGRHHDIVGKGHATLAHHGVADEVEARLLLVVVDLEVAERRLAARAPVDHSQPAVDETVVVEVDEGRAHGPDDARIEREDVPAPVRACAEAAVLLVDAAAVLPHPLPGPLDERLAAEVVAREALLLELPLDHVLRGDAGVVLAGQPQRWLPLHPVPAHERVCDRILETVAEMQLPGDVRGRHDDAVRLLAGDDVRAEVVAFLPERVDTVLDLARFVRGRETRARRRVAHRSTLPVRDAAAWTALGRVYQRPSNTHPGRDACRGLSPMCRGGRLSSRRRAPAPAGERVRRAMPDVPHAVDGPPASTRTTGPARSP